ncbi:hypothetical protein [Flaviaesturariibacter amylovorans]|uniref:Phospholipase D-like domain-containing protein n=1 Tax=Flaviaesturariibacter amylovorans TaxID=1084520 RepID=A0ABP8HH24_9BACT
MAEFLTRFELEERLNAVFLHAKKSILLLLPTLALDEHFRRLLATHQHNPELDIVIVFGKTEAGAANDLFGYFQQFNNLSLLYQKDLHASFYANEAGGLLSSISLADTAFRGHIEFGVYARNPEQSLLGLTTIKNPLGDSTDADAWTKATALLESARAVLIRRPIIQKKLMGLSTNYIGAHTVYDGTEVFSAHGTAANKTYHDFPKMLEHGRVTPTEKPAALAPEVKADAPATVEIPSPAPEPPAAAAAPAPPEEPTAPTHIPPINYGKPADEPKREHPGGFGYGQ